MKKISHHACIHGNIIQPHIKLSFFFDVRLVGDLVECCFVLLLIADKNDFKVEFKYFFFQTSNASCSFKQVFRTTLDFGFKSLSFNERSVRSMQVFGI